MHEEAWFGGKLYQIPQPVVMQEMLFAQLQYREYEQDCAKEQEQYMLQYLSLLQE